MQGTAEEYEVWSEVEGALETSDFYLERKTAEAEAATLAHDYRSEGSSWAVYILPHYCAGSDTCECAQWLQDHHPFDSSEA